MTGFCTMVTSFLAMAGDPGPIERSFGEAFFIARNADNSIELLGSVIIWLLLVLSIMSIGMIA